MLSRAPGFQLVPPFQPFDQDVLLWAMFFFIGVILFLLFSWVAMEKWTATFDAWCTLNAEGNFRAFCFLHLKHKQVQGPVDRPHFPAEGQVLPPRSQPCISNTGLQTHPFMRITSINL